MNDYIISTKKNRKFKTILYDSIEIIEPNFNMLKPEIKDHLDIYYSNYKKPGLIRTLKKYEKDTLFFKNIETSLNHILYLQAKLL